MDDNRGGEIGEKWHWFSASVCTALIIGGLLSLAFPKLRLIGGAVIAGFYVAIWFGIRLGRIAWYRRDVPRPGDRGH